MVLIDYNKIEKKDDFFIGHSVIVTGFDDENIYFHDSGLRKSVTNRKINKHVFENAMNLNGTYNDCVIVYGKR